MQLREERNSSQIRLYFSASERDAHALTEAEAMRMTVRCFDNEPRVVLSPTVESAAEGKGAIRTVKVNANNQVTVSFPRALTHALDLLEADLTLEVKEGDFIVVQE